MTPRHDQPPDSVLAAAFSRTSGAAAVISLADTSRGRIDHVTDAFCTLVERDHGVVVGRNLADLLGLPRRARRILSTDGLHSWQPDVLVARLLVGGGRRIDVELRFTPLPDGAGPPRYAVVAVRRPGESDDPTSRSLRTQIRRLQDIVENSPALIYVKDTAGRFIYINEYFGKRFGVRRDEVLGKTDFYVFPPKIAAAFAANDRMVARTARAHELEEPAEGPHGAYRTVKFPLYDNRGEIYAVAGISTDITDLKTAEAAAREARDEAERASRAKSEFLSRVSHELRTPLNSIIGFAQLLLVEPEGQRTQDNLDRILRAGNHLLALISEVLEQAQIESGHHLVSVRPLHATGPLMDALELARPLAMQRSIELAVDLHGGLHEFVLGDYQRLKQALLNILANGIKYNHHGGAVATSFIRTEPGWLRYLIADTGPGIRTEDLGQLFLPFRRLAAADSQSEGAGLGLALSKSLVEAMGGRLGILSDTDASTGGCTFFVDLPSTDPPPDAHELVFDPPQPQVRELEVPRFPPTTVLYVEDNAANVELVQQIFKRCPGVTVTAKADGESGLRTARTRRPDLVLLDLHLPDIPGEQVLKDLRSDGRTRNIPVIILSADATHGHEDLLRRLGAADYLTKPFAVDDLLTRAHRVVSTAVGRKPGDGDVDRR